MPRVARKRSVTGIYHVMVRAIGGQHLFLDDRDRLRYLDCLLRLTDERQVKVYGYCLMDNHVHLLVAEGNEFLGETMKRLGTSYVQWFNIKYGRNGHLFQDRFLSEPVEDDAYFLTVLRYIHQNPVKASLAKACLDYPWSSYRHYVGRPHISSRLVDSSLATELMGGPQRFLDFSNQKNADACLEADIRPKASDEDIIKVLEPLLAGRSVSTLKEMNPRERKRSILLLKTIPGASTRQIARLTGLSKSVIDRVQ